MLTVPSINSLFGNATGNLGIKTGLLLYYKIMFISFTVQAEDDITENNKTSRNGTYFHIF